MFTSPSVVARTTATNKKLRELLTAIRDEKLIPRPEFQRRLVWTNKDKVNFLKTVLEGYPFPEIYIAAGDVDPETGEGTEMLVDGQQRMTTLYEYFRGSDFLRLPTDVPRYPELSDQKKREFLEYIVVVRDLGPLPIEEIKEVFLRINLTKYALNAMEINNARFNGAFKQFVQEIAENNFFERHPIFSAADGRQMEDLRYILMLVVTLMSTYFNLDKEVGDYLERYNDEFPNRDEMAERIYNTLAFIEACHFDDKSRVWKKADFFTLAVELDRALHGNRLPLEETEVAIALNAFYAQVDAYNRLDPSELDKEWIAAIDTYSTHVGGGTNHVTARRERGAIIQRIIESTLVKE